MNSLACDFIRYVLARHPDARWPQIYDLLCRAAARREFRGLGYQELEREAGLSLSMHGMRQVRALVSEVEHQRAEQFH